MVLSLAQWAGLVLLECSSCGGLAGVWALGAVKWASLHVFMSYLTDGSPEAVLRRFVALLSLLSPALDSVRTLMAPPSEPYTGSTPDYNMLLLVPSSSLLACVIWEKGLCAGGKSKKSDQDLDSRKLLTRVLKYFRPDVLYLIAAFSFLILGVICECETLTVYILWHTI